MFHKLADDLVWMDDSLAALRVYDVLRVLPMIGEWRGLAAQDVELYASGRMNLYARLARALEPELKSPAQPESPETLRQCMSRRYYNSYDIKSFVIPGIVKY
jgi:hypothetical protein